MRGKVRWFEPERGYGFIAPEDGSADVFVHRANVVAEETLEPGEAVEFDTIEAPYGQQATCVRRVAP